MYDELNFLTKEAYVPCTKTLALAIGPEESIIIGELTTERRYWKAQNKMTIINGKEYFYSTRENIYNQTGLGENAQRRALQKLSELNIVETLRWGMPAKNYYWINTKEILKYFGLQPLEQQNTKMSRNATSRCHET